MGLAVASVAQIRQPGRPGTQQLLSCLFMSFFMFLVLVCTVWECDTWMQEVKMVMWRCWCSSDKVGMKLEALFLTLAARVLEVGLRSRPLTHPEETSSVPQVLHQECYCSCTCVEQSSHLLFGGLIGSCSTLVILIILRLCCIGSPSNESVWSPRRKGRGVVWHPGGDGSR